MTKPEPVLPENLEDSLRFLLRHAIGWFPEDAMKHRRAIAAAILRAKSDTWEVAGCLNTAAIGRAEADALEKEPADGA